MLVLGSFKKNVNLIPKKVYIDNIVFRLHYRITFWFLIVCVLIVGSREFMKEHISCLQEKHIEHVIDTYCFFATTFTVVKYHNITYNNLIAHPGVSSYNHGEDKIIKHAYYQWVPFVLFLQAFLFYLPHFIWKFFEDRRMERIVNFMKTSPLIASKDIKLDNVETSDSREKKISWLKTYLSLTRFIVSRDWALKLVLCEILNLLNLHFQIYLINKFLQGNFLDLGIKWFYNSDSTLDMVFPKVTKCTFHKYGSSGSIQIHDTLCVMGLNIINEKIYIVLWFWILGLYIVTLLGLLWRILTLCLHSCSPAFNTFVWGELSPGPALRKQDVYIVTKYLTFPDWLFLYYLGKNIDNDMFRQVVQHLSETFQRKSNCIILDESPTTTRKDEKESFC